MNTMRVQKEVHHVRFRGENFKRVADAGGVRWLGHPADDLVRWVEVSDEDFKLLELKFLLISG